MALENGALVHSSAILHASLQIFSFYSRAFPPLHLQTINQVWQEVGQWLGLVRVSQNNSGWHNTDYPVRPGLENQIN